MNKKYLFYFAMYHLLLCAQHKSFSLTKAVAIKRMYNQMESLTYGR